MNAQPLPPTGEGPPQAGPGAPERVLRRPAEDDRVLFGVASGLGRYLGVDPVLVRIGFVVLALFGGSGLLLYLIGAVVIPEERPGDPVGDASSGVRPDVAVVIGGALVVLGAVSLLGQLLPWSPSLVGPALLVIAGVLVILLGRRS